MPVERMGQYIGAKVTPSFFENPLDGTNDWVQGITYEELTVVTYDSKLYISKKPVRDITVDPTNTEYWLEYPSGGGGGSGSIIEIPSNDIVWQNESIIPMNESLYLYEEYETFIHLIINANFRSSNAPAGVLLQINNLPLLDSTRNGVDCMGLTAIASSTAQITTPIFLRGEIDFNNNTTLRFRHSSAISDVTFAFNLSVNTVLKRG